MNAEVPDRTGRDRYDHRVKPFLLIATRPEDDAARTEYETFCEFMGLSEQQLRWVRLGAEGLPPIDLADHSGIVLGGSPYNSTDPPEKKSAIQRTAEAEISALLDQVVARDFPFLGACYGVGTLGVHQGGVLDRHYGESAGAVTVRLTAAGREDPLVRAAGLPEEFLALVGHKEAVRELPAHAVNLGGSATCPVQMFRVGRHQYATQFHPELDVERFIERLGLYLDQGYVAPEDFEALADRTRQTPVEEPKRLLSAFADLFAT